MSSASPSQPSAAPKRRKFGTYSFVLAILAFAVFTVAFGIVTSMPNSASEAALGAALWVFILVALLVAPLMELTGIVLGIAALFRAGDRKVLGILGVFMNLFLLAGGTVLGIIVIASGGGPR